MEPGSAALGQAARTGATIQLSCTRGTGRPGSPITQLMANSSWASKGRAPASPSGLGPSGGGAARAPGLRGRVSAWPVGDQGCVSPDRSVPDLPPAVLPQHLPKGPIRPSPPPQPLCPPQPQHPRPHLRRLGIPGPGTRQGAQAAELRTSAAPSPTSDLDPSTGNAASYGSARGSGQSTAPDADPAPWAVGPGRALRRAAGAGLQPGPGFRFTFFIPAGEVVRGDGFYLT